MDWLLSEPTGLGRLVNLVFDTSIHSSEHDGSGPSREIESRIQERFVRLACLYIICSTLLINIDKGRGKGGNWEKGGSWLQVNGLTSLTPNTSTTVSRGWNGVQVHHIDNESKQRD